ncbi:MAG: bifunctional [glutamate--ammonia ligase]-adenylyl-L-tyrosine phosphorylase/[glutamate--ammonia-ligase] adenylyltransferase [Chromatiales bacterium]|nr:bifunctional [glutamate--ammonia ligase]-adenylyl-L-tyrosine phosphorylase/[glutamate--ammonia-ligase] adenylyltransferase [Gammaproteobacteria bacterium]MBW6477204.1 bifunctional [glutamate--ammonia ligase]-adenylyl-L-tyrosine phosphorylase/[glutamate--ammonia-ligase] adenylyltransferase [Chromatiales bacterium]
MPVSSLLSDLPALLHPRAERLWSQFSDAFPDRLSSLAAPQQAELFRVWVLSDFVAQACLRDKPLLTMLLDSGDLWRGYARGEYRQRVDAALADCANEAQLGERLRKLRKREMVRIAWRDLAGHADMIETTADLSALADACIDAALGHLHGWLVEQWGSPCDADGQPQQLVVIGMGKLGAHELNFSSDVDLIFAYPEDGETQGGRRSTTNQEFFVKLGQGLIRSLDANTAYGFVFRVDMRLRPFGESSVLALSFDAMEDYYQVHGREWERYAMIKARIVAGDRKAGAELMARLKPFMYRKYVDFGAFESLREMKAMIAREVQRKGMADNVKLGAGGIREVEFIGQAFQLIRGGRESTLQVRRILSVLEALRGFELLPDFVVEELVEAYTFLRNTEHRLQEYAEQQTHMLPTDEEGQTRLAWGMGFADWERFEQALREHMRLVHEHFEQVFAAPQTEHAEGGDTLDLTGVWQGLLDDEAAISALQQAGFEDAAEVYRLIQALRKGRSFLGMSAQGRTRMNHLIPLMIGAVGGAEQPDATLARLIHVLESIGRRSAYIALLVENPMALSQLVRLCDASPWIAHHLSRYPQLLDELLDPRSLYQPPQRDAIQNEVRQRLMSLDPEDMEAQMEVLRRIKQAAVLRVAAADVMEAVPLMVVSDYLTDIAEVMVEAAFDLAWRHLVARHGRPLCGDSRVCDSGFAVVAYGKMGGLELGYGSDLDIVFLHSAESSGRMTTGDKPVDNAVFYARLGQRMIHILNTRTPAGVLYEVDTRLRPDGASGLLVSNIDAFADYQRQHAWTWEHQALVRARLVTGDAGIAEAFVGIREEILSRPRELPQLQQEVREMREKMRSQLSKAQVGKFDLKQDHGGIADIEFMVQYAVLAWAHAHPALLRYSDNIRLLETLAECGRIGHDDSALLCDAYRAYRRRLHHLALQELPGLVDETEFAEQRSEVQRLWQSLMLAAP